MGSPLKVKREKEFRPKYPSVGPKSKVQATSVYENIGSRIPSLKDDDGDLTEEEINKLLSENTKAIGSDEAMSFTSTFASRIPQKGSPKSRRRRKK